MGLHRPCCTPCSRRPGFCRVSASCCLQCHMAWEVTHAAPFLRAADRERLLREHEDLAQADYPPAMVQAHSEWEEKVFQQAAAEGRIPLNVLEVIMDDHMTWERGQLHKR